VIAILGASGIVLSAIYSIFLYNRLSYGSYSHHLKPVKDINRREFYILISLLIPTFALGIFPNLILDSLHTTISSLLIS
jgi:NADH-ubiquinone oxidoreductase chain 4